MKIIKGDLSLLPKELEPTLIIGKMDLTYFNGKWSYKEELIKESYYKDIEPLDLDFIKKDSEIFLVYENKLVVGFLIIWKDWNNYGWIDELRVLREYQNQGYGKALILEAEKWAKSKGLIGLALESQDNNLIAARFYQKQGFVIGGINRQLYKSFKKDEIAVFWYKIFK